MKEYEIVLDEVMVRQLRKAGKNQAVKEILEKMFDKIERMGPKAGKLLDPKHGFYEVKNKRPPIRLYYKYTKGSDEIYVFEYEMKSGEKGQRKTIERLKASLES